MQRLWSADELGEHWTLGPEELKLLAELTGAGKLGLAAQLAYWRQHGHFPNEEAELAPAVVGHLAAQVGAEADALDGYDWTGRTGFQLPTSRFGDRELRAQGDVGEP